MEKSSIRLAFTKRLKELRKKHELTQQELAVLAGIDYKHIQRLESKNPTAIKIDTIQKIAKAFKISASKLLDF